MKFKAHGLMRSNPSFKTKVKLDPVQLDTSASGSFKCAVSPVSATIGSIPIRLAIPFMKPRRRPPLIATVGATRVKLKPFEVKFKGIHLQMSAVVGSKGIEGDVDCDVSCKSEMEVKGKVPVKLGSIKLNLCEEDDF